MDRISRQVMYMDMAEVAARRATCYRGNVGALLIREPDIFSIGYNGPPSGEEHCHGNACERSTTGGCARSVHAERNAITRQGRWPVPGADLYCTYSPCPECAAFIRMAQVRRVFYRHEYRLREGINNLVDYGIQVYRVSSAGIIISEPGRLIIDPETLR